MARKKRPDGFPKITLKNITRPEPRYFGWRVNIKRGGTGNWRSFPDGPDGPFESLRAAILWRNTMWLRLGARLAGLAATDKERRRRWAELLYMQNRILRG